VLTTFFKKEINNTTFLEELLQENINETWLNDALKNEMVDVNFKDKNKDTFLMKCIKVSKTKSALWLIDHNIEVTQQNINHKNALYLAIEKRNKEIITKILDSNLVNLEQRDVEGRTLLQNIVVNGHNEMAKILLNYGANINNIDSKNRNVIYDALSYGDQSFIKFLLSQEGLQLNYLDENGNSIMHHTEVVKNDDIAKKLLIAGADPTLKNKIGESYLLNTALRGKEGEPIIDVALEHGANVNSKTADDNTILMELIALSSTLSVDEKDRRDSLLRISKKMLKHGGNINAIEKNNESGLFNAIRLCDYDLISFLLSGGIDPNIQSDQGITVLNLIIYEGAKELDIILLLLGYDANPNIKNHDGKTIYELLNELILHNFGTKIITDELIVKKIDPNGQYVRIIKELLRYKKKGEDLNYLDSTGEPLFFKPLMNGHFPLFQLYIKNGLNVNTSNKANHTIFFEYVLKVFEENKDDKKTCEKFQNNISYLLSNKINRNYQDKLGWTIVHKIVGTQCNEILFEILTKIIVFDYSIQDYQGRTVVHNAVWSNKSYIIKKIYLTSPTSINIVDVYEILPITYAALLGNQKLVLLFLEVGSNISGHKQIRAKAIKKFTPMLKNLKELKVNIKEKELIRKIDTLIEQIARDFKIIK
jgi:ankyrin repeat protein